MHSFNSLVNEILNEMDGMMSGSSNSVLGPGVTTTSTHFSMDNYAAGDARTPKVIGSKIIKRNMPKDTIFKGNIKNKRKRKHRRRHKHKR
jgi:hypothetical protein